MSGQGIFWGLVVFGAVMAVYSYSNKENKSRIQTSQQAFRIAKLLKIVSAGTSDINFILATSPLVVSEHEKVVAVLPETELLEPKSVRIRQGKQSSSTIRIVRGFSSGSGSYTSTSETREQLKTIDKGTLVITDQRVAFLGGLKTINIDVRKISGVDESYGGVALHCEGKEKVESFKISEKLTLTYQEDEDLVSVPFVGQVLELLIGRTIAAQGRSVAV